jgi:hypothetical protein
LANPLDEKAREMKAISGKRKKTDDDFAEMARIEFEGGLYHDKVIGPYIPGANIEKSLVEGGRITKEGKQVERGLFVLDNDVPLIYSGPRDVTGLWADPRFRSTMAVKVGQARVMRTRPMFSEWSADADAEVDPGLLNLDALQAIADKAGAMVGIGDYRPRYGRFTVAISVL